jgi:group I intron endonuclease
MTLIGSGIYSITNRATGRVYIGCTNSFSIRWSSHKSALRNNRHANRQLQADWMRYGEWSFLFEVVEKIPMSIPEKSKEWDVLLEAEKRWINTHREHCYNA